MMDRGLQEITRAHGRESNGVLVWGMERCRSRSCSSHRPAERRCESSTAFGFARYHADSGLSRRVEYSETDAKPEVSRKPGVAGMWQTR